MAPLYSAQADRIRGLLQTTAIQCQNVASQQEPFSVCQMEEIRKLLEATATQCGAVSDHLSSPEDIVSWTLGCQSFFDQDQPVRSYHEYRNAVQTDSNSSTLMPILLVGILLPTSAENWYAN